MDTTSGKKVQVEFKDMLVECPRYKGAPLYISVSECEQCQAHLGLEKVTQLRGVDIYDILCGIPVRRRVMHLVQEKPDIRPKKMFSPKSRLESWIENIGSKVRG